MSSRHVVFVSLACLAIAGAARAEEPLFPFVVSYDTPDNVTNLSAWLDAPAGSHGPVRVQAGRLATDAGPIRFWATNLCFDACFPTHDDAEHLAARLARLGFNCVRMHHMDARSIWGKSPNKTTIDPDQLDRLDYLIYQLKLRGIYTNLNLHVSRTLGEPEGFSHPDQRPKYDKGLGNFEPRMIDLQKKYAQDLLTHVNPYTQSPYTREPAIALVEISNEDALFTEWSRGSLDTLPESYADTFGGLWNRWLQKKYGSTERLCLAWNVGAKPLADEMLVDVRFAEPLGKVWRFQRDTESQVEWSVSQTGSTAGSDARPCLHVVVTRRGSESWIPQLSQGGLALVRGEPYTLTFQSRADRPTTLGVNCMMDHEPWQRLGLSAQMEVGPKWREHRFTFLAERDDVNARVTFVDMEPNTYELADISLRPGGIVGLKPDQCLEDANVPVLKRRGMNLTEPARRDFIDFLYQTEQDYWFGMNRFLKEDLGVRSLVSGTQLSYGPVHVQAALDYIDAHAYWNHPSFPGRPWDRRNWFVRNVALVNSPGGTLSGLAVRRVAGKPFTVSEYNHPAPNVYAAEGFPMLAAFGAFQAWDGLFPFTYSHDQDFRPQKITGYFDVKSHTAKLVHMPACVAMFSRGDVAEARDTVRVPLGLGAEREKLHETLNPRSLTADQFGLDPRVSLQHAVQLDLNPRDAASGESSGKLPLLPEGITRFVSDTDQLRWNVDDPKAGYFIADTPNTKLFTGFVRGRTFPLGELTLTIGPTRLDWATVSITSIDGTGFARAGRVLVAATGWVENRGTELEDLGSDRVTLGDRWGEAPVLCEGISAKITLPIPPDRVRFHALDASGNRRQILPATEGRNGTQFQLDPAHKTLWYEIEIH